MQKFLREFITEWRRLDLPVSGETIVAAISGGADSVSLMLALAQLRDKKKLDLKFVAAHFNHGLRGAESDKDEETVKKLAKKFDFVFESKKWNTKKNHSKRKDNLEQAARLARYEFLENAAEKYGAVAVLTGHTMNDQAETFLIRLIRGSGIDGLGAMKPLRRLNEAKNILLARPMLNWAHRTDTEAFCRAEKIKYRSDPMNDDQAFLRVKIRKTLIPALQKMNPRIVQNLAKTAAGLQEETEEFEIEIRQMLDGMMGASKDTLEVTAVRELAPASRGRLLRLWLQDLRGDLRRLDREHFAAIERLISSGAGGKKTELPGGETVSLTKGRLVFRKTKVEKRRTEN